MPMNIFDITRTLGMDTLTISDDPAFESTQILAIQNGDIANLNRLLMSSHTGTHLDAPYHFFDNLSPLDQLPVKRFVLDAQVISIQDVREIRLDEIENYTIIEGQAILFKTRNRHLSREGFSEKFVDLTESAARWLVQKKISLVGIDYLSIERFDDDTFPVHRILLGSNILILEDIDLSTIEPGSYQLICLPLKFKKSDGAPCRAILIK